MIKQISVFVENRKGRLACITDVLGQAGIDLIAMSIADTTNFGIMRCIASNPEKTLQLLKQNGFTASTTEVIVAEVPDKPGGLASVLKTLDAAGISVEYLYSFVRTRGKNALILFRVEEVEAAVKALVEGGIKLLGEEEVYKV
jgi:ACT domain-containing protein